MLVGRTGAVGVRYSRRYVEGVFHTHTDRWIAPAGSDEV